MKKLALPDPQEALPGRDTAMSIAEKHLVLKTPMQPPYPAAMKTLVVGMGCFWGVERLFWQQPGVYTTAVGYAAGYTPNPTYEEVCSGMTGHNEVVRIVYDPAKISTEQLLTRFWENHDPTQGMRQGNDRGTQYRSGLYELDAEQQALADSSRQQYATQLADKGYGQVTTEVIAEVTFYFAEDYHQQYLAKNPNGYCNLAGTGVCLSDD